jgi:hypothetical protein
MTKRNVISLLVISGILIVILAVTIIAPDKDKNTTDQYSATTTGSSSTDAMSTSTAPKDNNPTEATATAPVIIPTLKVTIMYPENMDQYIKAVNEYISSGGVNPVTTWKFVPKTVTVNFVDDVIRSSVQAAAEQIDVSGGPGKVEVVYFKIVDDTAYVELNIDLDGFAGVSFATAKVHPLVEKTLLQFSQIKQVKFAFAPGDNAQNDVKVSY